MKPLWKMTETEKVDIATQIILKVAEKPDGMTASEIAADGISVHSSVLLALCKNGFLIRDMSGKIVKWKIADGKLQ